MTIMTDYEADALDEKWTKHPPKVGENGTGFFARRKVAYMIPLDNFSADYLMTKAAAEKKTPSQIVSELVRERINKSA